MDCIPKTKDTDHFDLDKWRPNGGKTMLFSPILKLHQYETASLYIFSFGHVQYKDYGAG
jgi:hypothetical protein